MWLNGFNDNLPGFPRSPCKYIECAEPYMGEGYQPGAPVDPTKPMQGPYGTGMSGPSFGLCPVTRDWIKESNPLTGRDWVEAPPRAPRGYDDTDNVMKLLAYKKISAYSGVGHGFYFWNFRTDLYEPHWSYMAAVERGWIPTGNFNDLNIENACANEDSNAYKCYLKPYVSDSSILKAVDYILEQKNDTATTYEQSIPNMTGVALSDAANEMISEYFDDYKVTGVTCDFGGIAMLVEENKTAVDKDFIDWDVAYFGAIQTGPTWWQLALIIILGIILGSGLGFTLGMRYNKKFNRMVRQSTFGRRMTLSGNKTLKTALSLSDLKDLDLDDLDDDYAGYGSTEQRVPLRG